MVYTGLRNGLDSAVLPSGTFYETQPTLFIVDADPMNFGADILISRAGSDIYFDTSTGSFGIATGGLCGSEWKALMSV